MEVGKGPLPEFGKYRAVREIGRGATSVVYLAEEIIGGCAVAGADANGADTGSAAADNPFPNLNWSDEPVQTPARVAVKLVDFTDDGSKLSRRFRKLFATEAAVSSQFDHPNITRVFDWKVEDERAYLVMEYLEGDTLDRFITMDRLLPMHRTVGIIFKIAMALDYAHRRGIVNRDIKPANIMLLKDDEVKVMDFGLALNIKKNVNIDSTFINGLGSPSYMSPEQIKGYTLNHQTDLYSLGVMFYQLLTGRLPFRATSTASLIYKIVNMEAVPVTQINPDIPELTNQVIAKAMEKDLYSRYRLGADMAKDLSAVRYQILEEDQVVPNEARWKVIRGLPLLGKLDDIDIWELLRLSHWRELPPATVLMREGEAAGPFGIVLEGEVEIEAGSRALDQAVRGDMLGVMEWLDSEASTRCVRATTLSRVIYLEINPAAFAFATEELAGEIRRLATDALLKRMRSAMLLAKRVSPFAIHPAPDSDEAEAAAVDVAAPVGPLANPLGWGAFASVDAVAPAARVAAPAATAGQPVPPPTGLASGRPTTTVVVQPMPASAAAAITRIALGGTMGGTAGHAARGAAPQMFSLDAGDASGLTGAPLLPDADRALPNPPHPKRVDEPPPDAMLTSEMAPTFMSTPAMDSPAGATPAAATVAAPAQTVPKHDAYQPDSTAEMAPHFPATSPFAAADFATPANPASRGAPMSAGVPESRAAAPATADPQALTSELAPYYAATTAFDAADFLPPAAPAAAPAKPPPAWTSPKAAPAFDPDKTVLLTGASQSVSAKPKPKPAPAFDPDKTVLLPGGFNSSGDADEHFTEELYPTVNTGVAAAPAPSSLLPSTARVRALPPEDFDKTVVIVGGFEAQPLEEDTPLDDLFPPIKF